jgi:hypothetical protein
LRAITNQERTSSAEPIGILKNDNFFLEYKFPTPLPSAALAEILQNALIICDFNAKFSKDEKLELIL